MKKSLPAHARPIVGFAALALAVLVVAACTDVTPGTPAPITPEAATRTVPPRPTQAPSPSQGPTATSSRTPRPTAAAGIDCTSGAAVKYGAIAQNVELIGQFGGAPSAVAVRDGYVYLEAGTGLYILDVADPDRPVPAGRALIQGNSAGNLTLLGQYAYVQAYGVCIVDVSNPQTPQVAGYLGLPDFVSDLAVQGGTAYLANGNNLRILDVSDPLHPVELGAYTIPERGQAAGVAVAAHFAYLVDTYRNLYVVDVTDPRQPKGRGALRAHGFQNIMDGSYQRGIEAAHDLVYLSIPGFGLCVIDANDPDHPIEAGALPLERMGSDMALSGDRVYLAGYQSLYVVDLADPARPALADTVAVSGDQHVVAAAPGFVYIASSSGEFRVIDVEDAARPAPRGVFTFPAMIYALDVQMASDANYVYVNDTGTLHIVDASDPARPVEAGRYQARSALIAQGSLLSLGPVSAQAHRVYAAAGGWVLQVVDVTDPARPQLLGECRHGLGGDVRVNILSGQYVFLSGRQGLSVIDVADPRAPRVAGTYPRGDLMAVTGRHAFVTTAAGIEVVDVSDPAHPAQVGAIAVNGRVQAMAIAGSTLYVSGENPSQRSAGLRIFDVTDPVHPVEIGTYPYAAPYLMRAAGHTLYLGSVMDVQMLDIRNPAHPVATGQYMTTSLFRLAGIAAQEPYVYALGAMGGLHVFYFDADHAAPLPTPTVTPDPRTPRSPPRTPAPIVVTANPLR